MAAYFARHAWGNTTLQDLIDELAAASGRDLDAWRAAWLETAGTDLFHLVRATTVTFELVATPPGRVGSATAARTRHRCLPSYGVRAGAGRPRERRGHRAAHTGRAASRRRPLPGQRRRPDLRPHPSRCRLARRLLRARTLAAHGALPRGSPSRPCGTCSPAARPHRRGGGGAHRCVAHRDCRRVLEPYLALALDAADLWSPLAERDELAALRGRRLSRPRRTPGRRQVALRGLARTRRPRRGRPAAGAERGRRRPAVAPAPAQGRARRRGRRRPGAASGRP